MGVHMAPAILVLLSVLALHPAARRDSSVQKTWTNDDIDSLRADAPISVFNPLAMIQIVAVPAKANAPVAVKAPYVRNLTRIGTPRKSIQYRPRSQLPMLLCNELKTFANPELAFPT